MPKNVIVAFKKSDYFVFPDDDFTGYKTMNVGDFCDGRLNVDVYDANGNMLPGNVDRFTPGYHFFVRSRYAVGQAYCLSRNDSFETTLEIQDEFVDQKKSIFLVKDEKGFLYAIYPSQMLKIMNSCDIFNRKFTGLFKFNDRIKTYNSIDMVEVA